MSSAAPGWADTSVRWLRTHYPTMTPGSSSLTFSTLLARALVRMKFRYREMVDERHFAIAKWKSTIEQTADEWTNTHHAQMVKFLESGGYKEPDKVSSVEKIRIPITGADGTTGFEEIELEMDDFEAEVDKLPAPKAQLSPKHELEEVVANALLESDPRFGVW